MALARSPEEYILILVKSAGLPICDLEMAN